METIATSMLKLISDGGEGAWMLIFIIVLVAVTAVAFIVYKILEQGHKRNVSESLKKEDIKDLFDMHSNILLFQIENLDDKILTLHNSIDNIRDIDKTIAVKIESLIEDFDQDDFKKILESIKQLQEINISQYKSDSQEISRQIQQLSIAIATLHGTIIGNISKDRSMIK